MRTLFLSAFMMVGASVASATPVPYETDARIRTVDYVADGVVTVRVSPNVVTRIVLDQGEKIVAAATGLPSKCDNDDHPWCIVADADTNEIWVKPKRGARRNNLELKTDRHDYSFDLEVGSAKTYRITMRYPAPAVSLAVAKTSAPPATSEKQVVSERLAQAQPQAKNTNYSLQSNQNGADITPRAVFDDGTFTYFRFPGNSEVPTIFIVGLDGKEARTNYSMQGDDVVVQRLGRKFVLRLGKAVVSVWNEKFDAQGTPPVNGTTVPGVTRESVGGGNGN